MILVCNITKITSIIIINKTNIKILNNKTNNSKAINYLIYNNTQINNKI
jgi:hypothetical protein